MNLWKKHLDRRLVVSIGVCLIYLVSIKPIFQALGSAPEAFALLPILVIGYYYGFWGGLIGGISIILLSFSLVHAPLGAEYMLSFWKTGMINGVVVIFTGAIFGKLMDHRKILTDQTEEQRYIELQLENNIYSLTQANRLLESYAIVASNDLKAPLRQIHSYLRIIRNDCSDKMSEEIKAMIHNSIQSAESMSHLIDDILLHSRVQAQTMQLTKIDGSLVIGQSMANLDTLIKQSNAQIKFEGLPDFIADRDMMVLLFQNLIENAVTYCKDRAPLISIEVKKESDALIQFSVQDNGIGIPEDQFGRILEPFARLHGKGTYEGGGMGLAICETIVRRHGGRLWVESEVGQGSTFHFTLPQVAKAPIVTRGRTESN